MLVKSSPGMIQKVVIHIKSPHRTCRRYRYHNHNSWPSSKFPVFWLISNQYWLQLMTFLVVIQNSIEISFCSYLNSNQVITSKFCTCHDSTAVMARAKIWSDLSSRYEITTKLNFYPICNYDGKIVTGCGKQIGADQALLSFFIQRNL